MSYESLCFQLMDARIRLRRIQRVRLKRRTWTTWLMQEQAESWLYHIEREIKSHKRATC